MSKRTGHTGGGARFLAVMIAILVIAGFGLSAMSVSAQEAIDPTATRIRFVQANTDQDKVEVFVNGDEKLNEFGYGDVSDWIAVEPGGVRVTITEDRVGFNYTIFDTIYPLLAGNDYQVVISDMLVIGNIVDRSPVPDAGARVQVIQAAVDLPAVDIVATSNSLEIGTQLLYGMSSGYSVVPVGTYDLEVRLASTDEVLLTVPGLTADGNVVYDLVITGSLDSEDQPLTVITLTDGTLEGSSSATPSA